MCVLRTPAHRCWIDRCWHLNGREREQLNSVRAEFPERASIDSNKSINFIREIRKISITLESQFKILHRNISDVCVVCLKWFVKGLKFPPLWSKGEFCLRANNLVTINSLTCITYTTILINEILNIILI